MRKLCDIINSVGRSQTLSFTYGWNPLLGVLCAIFFLSKWWEPIILLFVILLYPVNDGFAMINMLESLSICRCPT